MQWSFVFAPLSLSFVLSLFVCSIDCLFGLVDRSLLIANPFAIVQIRIKVKFSNQTQVVPVHRYIYPSKAGREVFCRLKLMRTIVSDAGIMLQRCDEQLDIILAFARYINYFCWNLNLGFRASFGELARMIGRMRRRDRDLLESDLRRIDCDVDNDCHLEYFAYGCLYDQLLKQQRLLGLIAGHRELMIRLMKRIDPDGGKSIMDIWFSELHKRFSLYTPSFGMQ
jgi:hypothetical protein